MESIGWAILWVLIVFAAGFVVGLLVQGGRGVSVVGRLIPPLLRLDVVLRRLVQYASEHPGAGRSVGEALGALAAVWAVVQGVEGATSAGEAKGPETGSRAQGAPLSGESSGDTKDTRAQGGVMTQPNKPFRVVATNGARSARSLKAFQTSGRALAYARLAAAAGCYDRVQVQAWDVRAGWVLTRPAYDWRRQAVTSPAAAEDVGPQASLSLTV